MGMVAVASATRGMDPWRVVRMHGSLLIGPAAVEPPGFVTGDVVIGLLVHLWLAILVGVIYASLIPSIPIPPLLGGLVAGALLYVLGFWVLPLLFPEWLAPFWLPDTGKVLQAVAHAIYGLVFGFAFQRLH